MVRLGPCKQVFEALRGSFLKTGYFDVGVSTVAQAAVAKQLTEAAFGRPAHYFVSAIPHTKNLLAFDQRQHRYSPVFSKWKICAIGKINNDEGSSLRTQHFPRGKFQVGSFRAITLKSACRSMRVTVVLKKVLRGPHEN